MQITWVPWVILGFFGLMSAWMIFDLVSEQLRFRKRWKRRCEAARLEELRALRVKGDAIKRRIAEMKWN